ncbi:phage integrase N-terminal SAM-like domain-containing protein [Candidatus Spongiihabitans sp.]
MLRRQGYAYATENTYCDWVSRFIKFHQLKRFKIL